MRLAGVEVILRETPVGDHHANGDAECAAREIQARVLRYGAHGPDQGRPPDPALLRCLRQRLMLAISHRSRRPDS